MHPEVVLELNTVLNLIDQARGTKKSNSRNKFNDINDIDLSTKQTSNSITVSGINSASPISIVGGSYSINGLAFTDSASTVSNGDSLRVRHTASAAFETATLTNLTIGGVSSIFSSTTSGAGTLSRAGMFWLLGMGQLVFIRRHFLVKIEGYGSEVS